MCLQIFDFIDMKGFLLNIILLFRKRKPNGIFIYKINHSTDSKIDVRMNYRLIHSNVRIDIVSKDYNLDEENQYNIISNIYFVHLRTLLRNSLSEYYFTIDFGVRKRYTKRIQYMFVIHIISDNIKR